MTHSESANELLVGFWKIGSGRPSMSWSESVDEALCFGWIDGLRRRIDESSYSIRFTPRRPNSNWSAVNVAKYESLLAEGKITPAGRKAFELRKDCKSDIYSYEQRESAQLCKPELAQFKKQTVAWKYFGASPPGYQKKMLHWVTSAKKAETRARRLGKLIAACARQKRLG